MSKQQYKIEHNWYSDIYTIVEIDFDFPRVEDKIRQMVEFWAGWEHKLKVNEGDYLKTFLQQVASWCWSPRQTYNTWALVGWFNEEEGWFPLDGTHGITILQSETIEIEDGEFEVSEVQGVKPAPSPFDKSKK